MFDDLLPLFLQKVAKSDRLSFLEGRPVPSYVATLAYYRVLPAEDVLVALKDGAFEGRAPCYPSPHPVWRRLTKTVASQCDPIKLDQTQNDVLLNSWADLAAVSKSNGSQFASAIQAIAPLGGADFGAASTPHLFGCIFVSQRWIEQPFEKRMTSLVHELAHQELFMVNLVDRLVNSSADYALAHAPLQGTMRPPIGRLHSAHALFRMRNFQREVGWESSESDRLLADTCRTFQPGELTPLASELVNKVYLS